MARTIAKDHDKKRLAILKTAARLFAEEGYGRASISSVATACGMSKANIYHYYRSKEALLFDILDTHLKALRDRVLDLEFASDAPGDQLRVIVAELLLAYKGADAEHAVQLNAISALPDDQQRLLKDHQRALVAAVRARIAQLVPPSVAKNETQLRQITMSVFAMVNWHYLWDGSADAEARRRYADLICDMVIGGIGSINETLAEPGRKAS